MLKAQGSKTDSQGRRLSVVVVDDEEEILVLLRHLVQAMGFHVAGAVDRGERALRLIRMVRPDLVLMDLCMPDMSGIEVISTIRHESPNVKFIVITAHTESHFLQGAIAAGAIAYLIKPDFIDELQGAMRAVLAGYYYLTPAVTQEVVEVYEKSVRMVTNKKLTPRQREIAARVGLGQTNREIAKALGIKVRTVEKHRENIRESMYPASVVKRVSERTNHR